MRAAVGRTIATPIAVLVVLVAFENQMIWIDAHVLVTAMRYLHLAVTEAQVDVPLRRAL